MMQGIDLLRQYRSLYPCDGDCAVLQVRLPFLSPSEDSRPCRHLFEGNVSITRNSRSARINLSLVAQ